MTALNEEHTIDFFISPMALFFIELTEIEEITGDSVKEALRNRMRPQMAVLLRAGRRRDSTLGAIRRLLSCSEYIAVSQTTYV